jgi:hypothetical protein
MISAASLLVTLAAVYLALGAIVAVGFALAGIGRALPDSGHVTWGARLLLIPGAALLWPHVLLRWIGARPV